VKNRWGYVEFGMWIMWINQPIIVDIVENDCGYRNDEGGNVDNHVDE